MTDDETGEMLDALCCLYKSLGKDWSLAQMYQQRNLEMADTFLQMVMQSATLTWKIIDALPKE
eukprot:3018691-Rhodomonas_salina.1